MVLQVVYVVIYVAVLAKFARRLLHLEKYKSHERDHVTYRVHRYLLDINLIEFKVFFLTVSILLSLVFIFP